jgi:hypothetical protein
MGGGGGGQNIIGDILLFVFLFFDTSKGIFHVFLHFVLLICILIDCNCLILLC